MRCHKLMKLLSSTVSSLHTLINTNSQTASMPNLCARLLLSNYIMHFVARQSKSLVWQCDLPRLQPVCLLPAAQGEERECAFTDQQHQWEVERVAGGEGRVSPENTTIRCAKGSYCFGLWAKSPPGEVRLVKQGMIGDTLPTELCVLMIQMPANIFIHVQWHVSQQGTVSNRKSSAFRIFRWQEKRPCDQDLRQYHRCTN